MSSNDTHTTIEQSYFQLRMRALGITPELNKIELWHGTMIGQEGNGENILKPVPIFRECPKGIEILVYNIERSRIKASRIGSRSSVEVLLFDKDYCITRLEHPIVKANGDVIKYLKPAGNPSFPFFPPQLVKKYEEGCKIDALYITEGFFKAFKADMHGIDCVGVQSITCLRDKETNELWDDIKKVVAACKVERLVWLTDGDFMNITSKELTDGIDLYKRPNVFYSSVYTFWEVTSSLPNVERYFAHINSDTLIDHPKGLDDVLCLSAGKEPEIAAEFTKFSIMAPGKIYTGIYITRINITLGVGKVKQYILKKDVTDFYLFHLERRPELKNVKTFKFNGTEYRYDEPKGACEIVVPGDAARYIRVGNDYYKGIKVPDRNGTPVNTLAGRAKGTIVDDHGKDFCKHIRKYDNFCIVPDHFNFQQIIHNCYNLYNPFPHEPEEGDCGNTLAFIRHIFSDEPVSYTDRETGATIQIPRYDLGLDYLTLAYKFPQQMLPILCLVSRERQTGKTTFINYVDALFQNNAISIGNEDIEADFNAHWAGKLFIMVDETKVDNGKVINKIKRLSTAGEIILNSKGKDQVKLPFFAKFILNSNHVEDFIRIDKEEIRFWIHKVPPLKTLQPNMLKILIDEIPAFLNYLNNRQMASKEKERHWFDTQLLQTEALRVVKVNSSSEVEKTIKEEIAELFDLIDPDVTTIRMSLEKMATKLLNRPHKKSYIRETLHKMGYKTQSCQRFEYPVRLPAPLYPIQDAENYKLYTMEKDHGRCYTFERKDFQKQ